MELWIRSQNKNNLIKAYDIWIDDTDMLDEGYVSIMANSKFSFDLGHYKTKERALEVLDEIQKKLQDKFLCKPNCLMKRQDIDREENILNIKYDKDFIMQPQGIDIVPINCDNVVYEMPKE